LKLEIMLALVKGRAALGKMLLHHPHVRTATRNLPQAVTATKVPFGMFIGFPHGGASGERPAQRMTAK
jgi:hypothetical protein